MQQLITPEQWLKARRVLYMTHLAIGDYYYQRTYLAELQRQYPHLTIDVWIDDCRSRPKPWHAGRNNTLCQWLASEEHIDDIYPIADSKKERKALICKAQAKNYDIIVFLARVRTENYAKVARKISSSAFVVGTRTKPLKKWLKKLLAFNKLDAYLTLEDENMKGGKHINQIYHNLFQRLLGLKIEKDIPIAELSVPKEHNESILTWLHSLKKRHQEALSLPTPPKAILINHLSTNPGRDLAWEKLVEVLSAVNSKHPECLFILNVPPAETETIHNQAELSSELSNVNIEVFTANEHFFQLPALIKHCDIVLTVETAIMHLASGLNSPQVVLMRKNAEHWCPVNASKVLYGKSKVNDIPTQDTLQAIFALIKQSNE